MRFFAAAKNSILFIVAVVMMGVSSLAFMVTPVHGVGVGVILCSGQSSITVLQPESDSIVTEPDVTINGGVGQATQIEVTVDDVFDSVVPLNLGQTTYEAIVHLTPGTHTIKLTAIDACDSGQDTSTTLILTYTPPPVRNADGEVINPAPTDTNSGSTGANIENPQSDIALPEPFRSGFEAMLRLLDIRSTHEDEGYSRLSILRAIFLTLGLYLAIFGAVTWAILRHVIAFPVIRKLGSDTPSRTRIAKWFVRIVGVIIFLASLLL